MPPCSRSIFAVSTCGWVNGSFWVAYAADLGRCDAGKDRIYCVKLTSKLATGGDTSKMLCSPWVKTEGPPPAPSIIAYPKRLATTDAGFVKRVEKGPNTISSWLTEIN